MGGSGVCLAPPERSPPRANLWTLVDPPAGMNNLQFGDARSLMLTLTAEFAKLNEQRKVCVRNQGNIMIVPATRSTNKSSKDLGVSVKVVLPGGTEPVPMVMNVALVYRGSRTALGPSPAPPALSPIVVGQLCNTTVRSDVAPFLVTAFLHSDQPATGMLRGHHWAAGFFVGSGPTLGALTIVPVLMLSRETLDEPSRLRCDERAVVELRAAAVRTTRAMFFDADRAFQVTSENTLFYRRSNGWCSPWAALGEKGLGAGRVGVGVGTHNGVPTDPN